MDFYLLEYFRNHKIKRYSCILIHRQAWQTLIIIIILAFSLWYKISYYHVSSSCSSFSLTSSQKKFKSRQKSFLCLPPRFSQCHAIFLPWWNFLVVFLFWKENLKQSSQKAYNEVSCENTQHFWMKIFTFERRLMNCFRCAKF